MMERTWPYDGGWYVESLVLALTIAIAAALCSGPAAASCELLRGACYTKCGCCLYGSGWKTQFCYPGTPASNCPRSCRANCRLDTKDVWQRAHPRALRGDSAANLSEPGGAFTWRDHCCAFMRRTSNAQPVRARRSAR